MYQKLDPLLFNHIFTMTKTNCMKRHTGGVVDCEYRISVNCYLSGL